MNKKYLQVEPFTQNAKDLHYVAVLRAHSTTPPISKQDVRHDSYASGYRQSVGHRYFPRRLRRR
ncbi:hypothetical protein EMIT0P291_20291 [Pseudomonas sp. IT-P291]